MALDKDAVANIAKLARIRIDAVELETLAGELSLILGWIEQLDEVGTDDVEAMTSVTEMEWSSRQDVVADGDCVDKVLANAPDPVGAFFTVPKVIE
ncbi:MAG: Asp-tRNA(Asn)/Glu-tRNA(Gln) amidotransferase subunit GatC [Rhodospirillales bacterium]|nr:Asp-tRNA(Asn)/Glu-tRNA(Gln) amidotransferase subunit GatC [Rhodospirillales bacterium]